VTPQNLPAGDRRSWLDRAAAAYPLVVAYLFLLVLYGWQTTRHPTPWLFTDELEWSGLSRGVAQHGVPELRLARAAFTSLYPYVIAPSWWLGSTGRAYSAIKYGNAALMTASLFPAYALARLFVPRPYAIVCGIATAAIPAAAYSGLVIPESLAYFWCALALWLIARALVTPNRISVGVAVAAVLIAPAVRSELAMLAGTAFLAALLSVATSARGRALIGGWSWRERSGAAALCVGAVIALGALATHHSFTWQVGAHFHHRAFTYGLWAVGAFAIGVGVLPVFAALVWIFGARFRARDERALAGTLIGAVVAFGTYTAVKASYLSTTFSIRVEERNLIYLSPIVFAVAARWLVAGRARVSSVALAAAGVAYLLETTPYHNNEHFYSDAPGLSVLQWLNRTWSLTTTDARRVVFGLLAASIVIAGLRELALRRGPPGRGGAVAGALIAVAVIGWNLTGEITAADSSNSFAKSFRGVLPTPPDWIDRETGRQRTMFIGQGLSGSNAFWSLEFWNQSIEDVWSVDASAPGPGPTVTPNYLDLRGAIDPQLPIDWIVAGPGVEPAGKLIETTGGLRLLRVTQPIRIAAAQGNITPDGWMSTSAWYYRFATNGARRGTAVVTLTRAAACGGFPSSRITIRVSRLRLSSDSQPVAGRLLALRRVLVRSKPCDTRVVRIPVRTPFRIDVDAIGTFQPSLYDQRQLSAQVGFDFRPAGG
jgi:hypothetical protein